MNSSLRYGIIAATSAALLALAPGLALAAAPASGGAGQSATTGSASTGVPSATSDQATSQPAKGLAGVLARVQKGEETRPGITSQPNATDSSAMNTTDKTPGVTSGPATGNPVVPNTAVTKPNGSSEENMAQAGSNGASPSNGMSTAHTAGHAAMGAGAPGTPAQKGTEAGTAPQPQSAKQ